MRAHLGTGSTPKTRTELIERRAHQTNYRATVRRTGAADETTHLSYEATDRAGAMRDPVIMSRRVNAKR